MDPFNPNGAGAANQGLWQQGAGLQQLQTGYSTVELSNASSIIAKLRVRRDELKRLLAAQEPNQAELEKIERMLTAAESPVPRPNL